MDHMNIETRKKALQNVASGHIDDAVTPDDFENIIRSSPDFKTGEANPIVTLKQTPEKTDTIIQISEKSNVTTKPTSKPTVDFEDDFHDPYWN